MASGVHTTLARPSAASRRTSGGSSRAAIGGNAHPALLAGIGDAAGRVDVMRQVNATAGNGAAARLALAARPVVQREDTTGGDEEDDASFAPAERPPFELSSARAWMTAQNLKKDAPPAPEAKQPAPGEPDIISGADTRPPDANESTRRGLSVPETWKGNRSVTYPDATGNRITKDITVSITLVQPGTGAKYAFAKGLNDSEVTLDSGGGLLPEKTDTHNLDLFGTNQEVPIAAGLAPVFANVEGILNAETMEQIFRKMQTGTLAAMRAVLARVDFDEKKADRVMAGYTTNMFEREGAGDNQVAAP